MVEPNRFPSQFDEHAAEEELERVRQALEQWRERRKHASETFDAFLRSFTKPNRDPRAASSRGSDRPTFKPAAGGAPRPVQADGGPATLSDPQRIGRASERPAESANPSEIPERVWTPEPAAPPTVPEADPILSQPFVAIEPVAARSRVERPALAAWLSAIPHHLRTRRGQALTAIGVLVVVAVVFAWQMRSPEETAVRTEPAAAPAAAPAEVPSAAPATAAASGGFQVELTTLRHVWVRIIVDGQRTVERELPGGERIPIHPQDSVVIRAGDAGAVRVAVNGEDSGAFGTDGFPATRTFTRPQ